MADRQQPRFEAPPRQRALRIGVGVGILVLLIFTGFVLNLAEHAVRREAESRVRTTAELGARLIAEQTLRFEELVGAYGSRLRGIDAPVRARLRPADAAAAQRALEALRTEVAGVDRATLTDPLGRVVATSPPRPGVVGTDLSGREWYRGVTRTHRTYLSRAFRSTVAGHPKVTAVALPLRARGGHVLGILVVTEKRRTQAMTDDVGRQLGVALTVTDQAGTIVGRTGHASDQLLSRMADPAVGAALQGQTGVERRTIDGVDMVSGYAPVRGYRWTVTADVPASAAFSGIPRLRAALLAASGIVAFVLLWLVPLLVARLSRARDALGVSEAFQSDLLPTVLPTGVRTHYVASEQRMLLGGDFIDALTAPDGSIAVCIGDVCGHGPRAAALGATLRAGWRTLAAAGDPVDRLDLLDRVVESERPDEDLFATVACAVVSPDGERVRIALAGHPPPVAFDRQGVPIELQDRRGPALGLGAGGPGAWPVNDETMPDGWTLALYTDGLIEARRSTAQARLGIDGLLALIAASSEPDGFDADALLARIAALAGPGGHHDDLALVLVDGGAIAERRIRTAAAHTVDA